MGRSVGTMSHWPGTTNRFSRATSRRVGNTTRWPETAPRSIGNAERSSGTAIRSVGIMDRSSGTTHGRWKTKLSPASRKKSKIVRPDFGGIALVPDERAERRGSRRVRAPSFRSIRVNTIQMPTIKKNTQSVQSQSTTPPIPAAPVAPVAVAHPGASPPPATPVTPPDPNAALEQYVQQTVTELDTIEVGLGNDPALTPAQKRHALKFRQGGDKIIGQIGNLAQQQQLDSAGLNVADMVATLGKAHALQPLSDRVAAFAKHIDDVIFKAESNSLAMGQQFYALLQRRALTDG